MYRQERWSMLLLLCLVLLPAVLLPAAQKQDKTTSSARNTVEERRSFNITAPCVMELMDEGMNQTQLSLSIRFPI
jgi:hypothetical protein